MKMATSKEEEVAIVKCPKCSSRMVKQPDTYALVRIQREPTGGVNFGITDDITSRIYVCPKCRFIEFYYVRS